MEEEYNEKKKLEKEQKEEIKIDLKQFRNKVVEPGKKKCFGKKT